MVGKDGRLRRDLWGRDTEMRAEAEWTLGAGPKGLARCRAHSQKGRTVLSGDMEVKEPS